LNKIQLTLEQKVGQMIMAGFPSTKQDAHIEKLIREYNIGNIDLFSRNIGSVKELADLLGKIQSEMVKYNKIPAFIGTDQEGGSVSRIRDQAVLFPCNMAFAAADIPHSTWRQGAITGDMLRMLGINLNIAPVLDVNNNPENPIIGLNNFV
jgi:beta-N-acetylhexosaminidase